MRELMVLASHSSVPFPRKASGFYDGAGDVPDPEANPVNLVMNSHYTLTAVFGLQECCAKVPLVE
jgi:hypothetical protein